MLVYRAYAEITASRRGNDCFFETSAKTSVNVKEAFMDLVERIDKLDAQSGSSKKKKSKCTLL